MTDTTSIKEVFFRDYLIPAGQLAEVYVATNSTRIDEKVPRILFETLGLASAYAISPATPAIKSEFNPLSCAVQRIIDLLMEDLNFQISSKKSNENASKMYGNARSMAIRLEPLAKNLHEVIGYNPVLRGAWMGRIMEVPTPITKDGQYKKWRTFVRNIDFEKNMNGRGLQSLIAKMPTLASGEGKLQAPSLWRECFDVMWDGSKFVSTERAVLPQGVVVRSNDIGMLDVEFKSSLAGALKEAISHVKNAPEEVIKAMAEVKFTKTCTFTELPAVIAEIMTWQQERASHLPGLLTRLREQAESEQMDALQAKLKASFSAEEIALLAKMSPAKLVKPATAATTKRKARAA